MNALYIAHIVADFLLQPNRLAAFKEKRFAGVLLHAGIHGAVMGLFLWPTRPRLAVAIVLIAGIHAVVDQLKIAYQRKSATFGRGFIIDQAAHFIVLTIATLLFPFSFAFWFTTPGRGILTLLFFFSFTLGLWHLVHLKKYPLHTKKDLIKRIALISVVFATYLAASRIFASPPCVLS